MLGRVVFGSRTWICTIAAPALAASTAERAICSGVTGTAGLRLGVSADPVTAHEIMTLRCMSPPSPSHGLSRKTLCEVAIEAESDERGHGRSCKLACSGDAVGVSCHPLCTAL